MGYTEDTLVQQTTAEYLEKELGWESVYGTSDRTAHKSGSLTGRWNTRPLVPLAKKFNGR